MSTQLTHVVTCLSFPSCGTLYRGDAWGEANTTARRHSGELTGGPVPVHSVVTTTVRRPGVGGPGPTSPRTGPDRSPQPSGSPAHTVEPERSSRR